MSFADELRRTTPKPKSTSSHPFTDIYIQNAKLSSKEAAESGRKNVSFYVVDNGYDGNGFVESLPLFEGTPQQKQALFEEAKNHGIFGLHIWDTSYSNKKLIGTGYEIKSISEAKVLSNEIYLGLQELGFSQINVEIKQFHYVEETKNYLAKKTSYREHSSTFYTIRVSISW